MARSYDQLCPIARTLDLIGERWTMLVLRQLYFGDTKFSQLLQNLPGIPATVLSDRLKKLEEHGLTERAVYSQHPLRAEYRLTAKGESLQPVLGALAAWGMEHCLSDRDVRVMRRALPGEVLTALGLDG
ncbi:MAG: helix-turn-helix domain-containing protein [Dehalococcoidia bacterium]